MEGNLIPRFDINKLIDWGRTLFSFYSETQALVAFNSHLTQFATFLACIAGTWVI